MNDRSPAANAAHDTMLQMIAGYRVAQVVRALAVFGVADRLAQGPATAGEIAAAAGADAAAMFRLLRACASLGLVGCDDGRRFAATPLIDTLRRDRADSLGGIALALTAPGHWLPWGRLVEAVRSGESQAKATLGMEIFEHYAANPAEAQAFTDAMSGYTKIIAADAARVIDTAGIAVAADIGGAGGTLLHGLLEANPALEGIVFDRPNVVPSAVALAEQHGLGKRIAAVGGDFFQSVPAADLYLLKFILHDWDDDACVRILRVIAGAMRPGGRLVVIELLLGKMGEAGMAPMMDLNMMVLLNGRERTLPEFQQLFATAGLRFTRLLPSSGPMAFIEAIKA